MANRTDVDEYAVVSNVQTGLKREFAVALNSESEIIDSAAPDCARNTVSQSVDFENNGDEKLKSIESNICSSSGGFDSTKEHVVDDFAPRDCVRNIIPDNEDSENVANKKLKSIDSITCSNNGGFDSMDEVEIGEQDNVNVNLEKSPFREDSNNEKSDFSCDNEGFLNVARTPARRFTRSALKPRTEVTDASRLCLSCRGPIDERGSTVCNACAELDDDGPQANATTTTEIGDRSFKPSPHPKTSKIEGKITKKDLGLHKLVFKGDALADGTEVAYYVHKQEVLIGYKQGSGILCSCCQSRISPSQFEAHAGFAARRKPFHHIFITHRGKSLHQVAVDLSIDRKISKEDSDDLCSICFNGDNLMFCDGCPRAFHQDCVSLSTAPTEAWYCKNCQINQRQNSEHTANAIAAGRDPGIDLSKPQTGNSSRKVTKPHPAADFGGCFLCRLPHFSMSTFGPQTVLICDQCEKEYHVECLRKHELQDLKELPEGTWFCSMVCTNIHCALDSLVDHGDEDIADSLMDIITQKHDILSTDVCVKPDIKWRLVRGKTASDESKKLLSQAIVILRQRFGLIPDSDSDSSRDLIPGLIFGKKLNGRDFGGMYCAVLTVNSVVVSAGIVRAFGAGLAELPLAATSIDHQGKGYFQALFSCIEGLLGSLNVKNLVIPAAAEAEAIWTGKFGFNKLSKDELNNYLKHHDLMIFQKISWLQKPVPPCPIVS